MIASRNVIPVFVSIILLPVIIEAEVPSGQFADTRCICQCPEPSLVIKSVTAKLNRTVYIPTKTPSPSECICEEVVIPLIRDILGTDILQGKEGEFCPRCNCRYSRRNTTIIQVIVIIVIWIVSLLIIYMLFLMCLEPLLNKRIKSTAYTEHTNEDDETIIEESEGGGSSAGGSRTAHSIRMTSTSDEGPASSVLNRVGNQQTKWKRQVQEQRKSVYDRHTMLN